MNIDLENHVNPFSLTGARCRIRSRTARASPLRTAAAHGGAPGDDHLGMRLRSATGAAALDPDDFFAEIGVTAPKFSETGRKQHLIRGPTPVSTVLPEKQFLGVVDSNNRGRASGAAHRATQGGRPSVHAPGRPGGRYDRTARRTCDDTPAVQEAFLTEPSIPDAVARHGALARAASARALESIIERSLGRAASPSAAAPAPAGSPAAPSAPAPPSVPTPASTSAAPAPAPRQPASAFRREVLAETRARFSAAEAQVQLTRMQALASKGRDAERARFERQLCAEARRREGVERDIDVCGAQLEAARQEAASLRHAFQLLARRQAFEHELLLRCEEALQRHADAQPLVALLGEAFLHVPPEEVVQKYETLEAGYLQAHRASETLLLAARRLEGELADARDDGRAQTRRVSEQLTRKLAAADARYQALQAENDRLRESVALTQDSQAKYLQLSYAVAEMWNRWTDAKTLGGSVAALASARVGGKGGGKGPDRGPDRGSLHPNLSEPLQVIRSMNTLLAVCFPQADASSEAFRRIATLANHAWTRLFVFPEAGRGAGDGARAAGEGGLKDYDHLRGDPYKILEECVRRAEQAHADRQGTAGRAARTAAENKMLREDVERLTARLRQVESDLRRWEGKAGLAPR